MKTVAKKWKIFYSVYPKNKQKSEFMKSEL